MKKDMKKIAPPNIATKERKIFQSLPLLAAETTKKEDELNEDIIELFPELGEQWRALTKEFVGPEKYDHKSITDFKKHDKAYIEAMCPKVNGFFQNIFRKASERSVFLTARVIKEEAVKMFVIALQWTCSSLIELLSNPLGEYRELTAEQELKAQSLLDQREIHNDLILILMQDRRSQAFMVQHDTTIMQIIRMNLMQFQERLAQHSKLIDLNKIIKFFYLTFQAIAMLAAFQQNKKFMKGAAYEGIRFAFEILERSLELSFSSPVFQEIFNAHIVTSDDWVKIKDSPKFCMIKFGKKKLSLVHISRGFSSKEQPLFSLRFVNIYYTFKIIQILMSMKRFVPEDRTLDVGFKKLQVV